MISGLIYKATNILNKKCYVGQTCADFNFRIRSHKYCCNKGLNTKFYNAMRKYGFENFKWEILENNIPSEFLNMKESEWIQGLNSLKNGYNSTIGGDSLGSMPKSEDHKRKISESEKGKIVSKETIEKLRISHIGQKAWNKGSPTSKETKKKQSLAKLGKPSPRKGKKYGPRKKNV